MFLVEVSDIKVFTIIQMRFLLAHLSLSIIVLFCGCFLIFFSPNLVIGDTGLGDLVNVAGVFISSLTSFPLRNILSCYKNIAMLKLAQEKLIILSSSNVTDDEKRNLRQQIQDTIEKVVEKI